MIRQMATLSAVALLAACSSGGPALVETPAPQTASLQRVSIAYGTVGLREVSLPRYATQEEIGVGTVDGVVTSGADTLWADDPVRSVTLGLTRALRDVTKARVASDPWPFRDEPEVTVDVRFETFLPREDGVYEARALYYVAPTEREGGNHAHSFEIEVPYAVDGGLNALAAARTSILGALAVDIAKTALK